jgi:hypothetical protein
VEQGQGAGAHLRHPGERHPEVTGDIGQRFITEEIALDDLVEPVGQFPDRVLQRAAALGPQQRALGGVAGIRQIQ